MKRFYDEKCPYCNSNKIKYIRKIISPYNQKVYRLHDCLNCDLSFFTPLIFENIYETGIASCYNERHKGEIIITESSDKLCRYLKEIINTNNKILDIGASDCVNFFALKEYYNIDSTNYYALELDRKALEVGRKAGVENIFPFYFDKAVLSKIDIKFDIIIASEVLEHQVDPKDFMETCFKLLKKKDGILVITVPNKERFFMKQREMNSDVPPHHFLKFNKKFFIKNFNKQIIHIEDFYNRLSNYKSTSERLSKNIFKTKKYWLLFIPFIPFIRLIQLIYEIRGDKLLVVFKNL